MCYMITLRNYQKNILLDVYQSMSAGKRRPLVTAPCGSGKTILFVDMAARTQRKNKSVIVLVHRRELMKQTIDTFRNASVPLDSIGVHMAQTYSRHLAEYDKPDLIITDEAHMSQAATWRRIFDRWPGAYVVGFSASPCRLDGKPLGEIYDDLILGPTTAELIRDGFLAPYRYFSVTVADIAGLKRKGSDYDLEDAERVMMERAVYGDVIKTFREHATGKRTVVYCTTIQHSQKTAAEFRQAGFAAEHIDGTTPEIERDSVIDRFRTGETQILTNCQIVDVGFDLPAIECCVMLRPTMSTALFIQQSGRALRPLPGKTALILDFVGNHIRHGLPDDDREWSLTDRVRERPRFNDEGQFTVRHCQECFAVYPSTMQTCPECGSVYESTREEIKQIGAIYLKEIQKREENRFEAYKETRAESIDSEDDCRTWHDLFLLAKKMGKKNARGYATARSYALGLRRPW